MNKTAGTIIFVLGATVGSLVTWEFAKRKFEQLAREEIDSVKEVYSKRASETRENDEPKVRMSEKPDVMEYYKRKVKEEGYMDYSDTAKKPGNDAKPYIISPNAFGELDNYETISLTYYSDGVITDENDQIVENADEIIGEGSLNHFGEYEDDSVFVRNDKLKADYEILSDQRSYSDVSKALPPKI